MKGKYQVPELSNENIFAEDIFYKIRKDLSFDQQTEEDNCIFDTSQRRLDLLKFTSFLLFLRATLNFLVNFGSNGYLLILINVLMIVFTGIIYLQLMSSEKNIANYRLIRVLLEIDNLANFLLNSCQNEDPGTYPLGVNALLTSFFYNMLFSYSMLNSIYYYLDCILFFVLLTDYPDKYFFTRFFLNLFSLKFIIYLLLVFAVCAFQYFFVRAQRILWALYDSFKRSYNNLSIINNSLPFPLFIISKTDKSTENVYSNYTIQYKNTQAEALQKIIQENRHDQAPVGGSGRKKEKEMAFKELLPSNLIQLFDKELTRSSQRGFNQFEFPFYSSGETKEVELEYDFNPNGYTNYRGKIKHVKFYKVNVSNCTWKNNPNSLVIQLLEISNSNLDHLVLKASLRINTEFENILSNIGVMTEGMIENILEHQNKKYDENLENDGPNLPNTNSCFGRADLKNLYLIRSNLNYIHDLTATLNALSGIKYSKINFSLHNFNLRAMFDGIVSNLKLISRLKKVDITLSESNDENIYASYDLYRIIYFNLLQFILNYYPNDKMTNISNSGRTERMPLNFNVNVQFKMHKFFVHRAHNYRCKITFSKVFDEALELDKVHKILNELEREAYEMNLQKLIDMFDLGIVIAYYLLKFVYNGEIQITELSDSYIYQVTIGGISPLMDEKKLPQVQPEKEGIFKLSQCFIENEKILVDELLKKLYGISDQSLKHSLKNSEKREVIFPKTYIDETTYDGYTMQDEEEYQPIAVDWSNYHENQLKILNLSQLTDLDISRRKGNEDLLQKKITKNEEKENKKGMSTAWGSAEAGEIKYCKMPRYLIAEENTYNENNIRATIKKLKFKYMIDLTANGKEALKKFKGLFNRGLIFDCILIDVDTVGIMWRDFVNGIKKLEQRTNLKNTLVAITNNELSEEAKSLFDIVIKKPLEGSSTLINFMVDSLNNHSKFREQ